MRDAPFLDAMAVNGRRPIMAMVVEIDEVFHHCAKAFMRSGTWDPGSWHPGALPPHPVIAKELYQPDTPLAELEEYYGPSYRERLY